MYSMLYYMRLMHLMLRGDDRKFFYNNLSGFGTIYYDGMPRLSANQIFDLSKIPNYSILKKE